LGCVLYEMLAGTPPFTGTNAQAIMARHAVDDVPCLRIVRRTVSPALEHAVERALCKAPADRWTDARAFRDALDAALAGGVESSAAVDRRVARRPWRRTVGLAAAGLLALGGAGVTAWRALSRGDAVLDARRVTVFPLATRGDMGGSRTTGEDVATVIGNSLDRVGALRWIDGSRLVAGGAAGGVRAPELGEARRLARAQRAAFYLTGTVLPLGRDSATVLVDLYDTAGDSAVDHGRASGPARDAWRLGLRAVNAVLPTLVPGSGPRDLAAGWAEREPAAVASFLLGEAAFRRVRVAEALAHYHAAVRADTGFALAA
jgi:hypothetical protein